jgi:dTDP-4-dehydrorhamnose 3,5-epimerase
VLYDDRKDSETKGQINEFDVDSKDPTLIEIPPEVWHGFKNIGQELAIIVNVPTELYNYESPDEFRMPPDTNKIPYKWGLEPGIKHG